MAFLNYYKVRFNKQGNIEGNIFFISNIKHKLRNL